MTVRSGESSETEIVEQTDLMAVIEARRGSTSFDCKFWMFSYASTPLLISG